MKTKNNSYSKKRKLDCIGILEENLHKVVRIEGLLQGNGSVFDGIVYIREITKYSNPEFKTITLYPLVESEKFLTPMTIISTQNARYENATIEKITDLEIRDIKEKLSNSILQINTAYSTKQCVINSYSHDLSKYKIIDQDDLKQRMNNFKNYSDIQKFLKCDEEISQNYEYQVGYETSKFLLNKWRKFLKPDEVFIVFNKDDLLKILDNMIVKNLHQDVADTVSFLANTVHDTMET